AKFDTRRIQPPHSAAHEEHISKPLLAVCKCIDHVEVTAFGEATDIVEIVFDGYFRMNCFPCLKTNFNAGIAKAHSLISAAHQKAPGGSGFRIVCREVLKLCRVEVCTKVPIEAFKQIQIKTR